MVASLNNLQTDLLRSFVSVVDLGGYTKAGEALGRTQPAVSLQMRRLEELVGVPLFVAKSRAVELTEDGQALLRYAREILRINDEATAYFRGSEVAGMVRVGLPSDYAVMFLQGALTQYMRRHRAVRLEIHCDWSPTILQKLEADEIDVAIAMMSDGQSRYLSRVWAERPIWAAAKTLPVDKLDPLPLAVHPQGCAYRERITEALNAIGRRWRIAYSGPGITGLQNAVQNGIGISALTGPTMLEGLRELGPEEGFPPLKDIRVGLFYKHPRLSEVGLHLVNHLIGKLDEAAAAGADNFRRRRP
ncbi:LysR substrate-binding domain-containing protein [Lutibaculum baratangense]|uniref:Transcriptional regulator, LysR family n=1 Tax=Lutibaculum baratangense AMV1 TaxID=631454 RepID=V4RE54_9HYPH|nr:LysR substrate-binding domain-containing protein [Lutibaculum baratangense]ESR24401.1 Transcriptional regulator, LysR family [Lutibaculum baratangense AMV1]